MNADGVRVLAESLSDEEIGCLRGEHEDTDVMVRLMRRGLIDAYGRLKPAGVLVARYVARMVTWTDEDSIALTAAIVAHDGARLKLKGAELVEAIRLMAAKRMSATQMAARLRVGQDRITQIARDHGIEIRRYPDVVITEQDKKKILACPLGRGRVWAESW